MFSSPGTGFSGPALLDYTLTSRTGKKKRSLKIFKNQKVLDRFLARHEPDLQIHGLSNPDKLTMTDKETTPESAKATLFKLVPDAKRIEVIQLDSSGEWGIQAYLESMNGDIQTILVVGFRGEPLDTVCKFFISEVNYRNDPPDFDADSTVEMRFTVYLDGRPLNRRQTFSNLKEATRHLTKSGLRFKVHGMHNPGIRLISGPEQKGVHFYRIYTP